MTSPKTRRFRCLVFAALPLLLMAPRPGQRSSTPSPSRPARDQARPTAAKPVSVVRSIELIAPGTVIGKTAPKGWSHLVLKSQPRLPADQRRLVNDLTARLACFVFTTTIVHVEANGTGANRRYRLARIGMGVGSNIGGQDVVISPETQQRLGANLGLLARQVLSAVHEKVKTARLVAVGPTVAILDTPAFMPRGKEHAGVIHRYVFLVDARTGRLDTLVWRIDIDRRGGYEGAAGLIEWLPPNKMFDAVLQVDVNEFRLGIPSEKAFAVRTIPDGHRQFSIPDGLRRVAGASRLTSEEAGWLHQSLRDMIGSARESTRETP